MSDHSMILRFGLATVMVIGICGYGRSETIASGPAAKPAMIDLTILARMKERIAGQDPALMPALNHLRNSADEVVAEKKIPTVMDKTGVPPSGDKHDYTSVAVYHWPNPDTPSGFPWVYRDGQFNQEEIARWDGRTFWQVLDRIRTTAAAYALTGNKVYAERSAMLLKAWFVNPETRMSPNLKYGQFIPGKAAGTSAGIIETREIGLSVLDPSCLLAGSPYWTPEDQAALRAWASAYLDWLLESPLGKEEGRRENNHSIWYDAQVAWLAAFSGRTELARQICKDFGPKRLASQVAKDGSLPEELKRTRSLHYTIFALEGAYYVAHIGKRLGVDVYHYQTDDGRGLKSAIDYVLPALTQEKPWPHEEIAPERIDSLVLRPLLREAAQVYNDAAYERAAGKLSNSKKPAETRLDNLLVTVIGP